MTIYQLCEKIDDIYCASKNFQRPFLFSKINRYAQIDFNIADDLLDKLLDFPFPTKYHCTEISKIKLAGNYSRKNICRVFSQLGLKVTRYTREYGRTIVHFEDASDPK